MRKTTIICIILASLLLVSCAKNYTKADADRILKKNKIRAEFISEEKSENDTIWTYKDKKSGANFRIIEYWYETGIDGTTWDASELMNEYPYLMTDIYIQNIPVSCDIEKQYYCFSYPDFLTGYELTYEFTTEKDLKEKIKECNKIAKALLKKNKNCRFRVNFYQDKYIYSTTMDRSNKKIKYKDVLQNYKEAQTNGEN